jgi:hypothetical protein
MPPSRDRGSVPYPRSQGSDSAAPRPGVSRFRALGV